MSRSFHVATDTSPGGPRTIASVKARTDEGVPFDPHTEWVPLADEMTNGQWEGFALAVLSTNRGAGHRATEPPKLRHRGPQ